ncbi:virion assembly protein [Cotia virus SPAn232]|uniref:Virion assembly protein n=2 Tax=Cotia virus TaxID=39444 RepID=H6TA70_9POXV|nr:virion assembly protein [Cotia virus SPAn232]ADT91110.2 virion assembly protein [Cotia virus SPAn232]AIT70711.1 virion assembly protein [Cotia virus]
MKILNSYNDFIISFINFILFPTIQNVSISKLNILGYILSFIRIISISMDFDILKFSNIIQDYGLIFPDDIKKIQNEKFLVLERGLSGKLYAIHIYDFMARFDNETIFGIAKFLYRNNTKILDVLFINKDLFDKTDILYPKSTITLSSYSDEYIDYTYKTIKLIFLNLFNSFRFSKIDSKLSYLYLPLRKDINNVIL